MQGGAIALVGGLLGSFLERLNAGCEIPPLLSTCSLGTGLVSVKHFNGNKAPALGFHIQIAVLLPETMSIPLNLRIY